MGAEDLGDCARLALAGFAGVNFFAADVGLDEGSFLLGAAFDGADTTLSISSSFFSTSALTLLSVGIYIYVWTGWKGLLASRVLRDARFDVPTRCSRRDRSRVSRAVSFRLYEKSKRRPPPRPNT